MVETVYVVVYLDTNLLGGVPEVCFFLSTFLGIRFDEKIDVIFFWLEDEIGKGFSVSSKHMTKFTLGRKFIIPLHFLSASCKLTQKSFSYIFSLKLFSCTWHMNFEHNLPNNKNLLIYYKSYITQGRRHGLLNLF